MPRPKGPRKRAKVKRSPTIKIDYETVTLLASVGATGLEVAEALDIPRRTWEDRIAVDEKLQKAFKEGSASPDRKVVQSLYRRAIGYEYLETVEKIRFDEDGNRISIPVQVTKKHLPGDTKAIMSWLTNRTEEWKDNRTLRLEGELTLRDRAAIAKGK